MKMRKINEDETKEHYVVLDEAIRRIDKLGFVEIELLNGDIKRVTSKDALKQLLNF